MPSLAVCGKTRTFLRKVIALQDFTPCVHPLALLHIFLLLNPSLIVWQAPQREKDKYRLFPVDIVPSELAVMAFNNLAPILYLASPFSQEHFLPFPNSPCVLFSGCSPPFLLLLLQSSHFHGPPPYTAADLFVCVHCLLVLSLMPRRPSRAARQCHRALEKAREPKHGEFLLFRHNLPAKSHLIKRELIRGANE